MKTALWRLVFVILSILVLKNAFLNAFTITEIGKTRVSSSNPPPPGKIVVPARAEKDPR